MIDVVCIGHPTVDIYLDVPSAHLHTDKEINRKEVCLLWGEKYYIHRLNSGLGGNALNVAVGLQQLGLKSTLVASLGTDFYGDYARKTLEDMSIDLQYVQPVAKTDTSIVMNFEGDRTILSYHADEAYSFPSDLQQQPLKWVFLTSTGFSTFPDLFDTVSGYLAEHPEVFLAMNPGPRELEEVKATTKLLPRTELLILNFEEACTLAEKKELLMEKTGSEQDHIQELMTYFLDNGVKNVVITNGGSGAYGSDGKRVFHQVPFPSNIVEKTGAGDAFTTGVLGALITGKNLEDALTWGAAESASVMETVGAARGLLDSEAVQHKIRDNFALKPKEIATL
ncbi:carbohydrate kinase family protein [candidate division WWE3 bacterium]|uniref:Carbohydrate kinase family protein n=1 Tax=candidate division WWE3 bacterium TaxID=2053526 RepID=A0A955RP89_UNCKA|nr:carbohydrate kinase family protein [candidate division WWE3 bacterium]